MTTNDGQFIGVENVHDSGPPGSCWNLALLSEGYRDQELPEFEQHVQNFCTDLFATAPFDQLEGGINVYRVAVESVDSGADEPMACGGGGQPVRTYFDATFCADGVTPHDLQVDDRTVFDVLHAHLPIVHAALVMVNSPRYGGSGGQVGCMSRDPQANMIGIHELAHCAFGLADEYDDLLNPAVPVRPGGLPIANVNVSESANPATVKWAALLTQGAPVPVMASLNCANPDLRPDPNPLGTVAIYEGAAGFRCGAYRSQHECLMRRLGMPFCRVCVEKILSEVNLAIVPPSPVP